MNYYLSLFRFLPDKRRKMAKMLTIMKLTTIFLLVACLRVSAVGYAQNVTISVKDATLQEVFLEIYHQTGYQVFYQDAYLDKAGKVNIEVKDTPIETVLHQCLDGLGLTYSITNSTIVLKPAGTNQSPQINKSNIPPVTGKVKDAEGNPIPGAVVMVKGTQRGTATDADGKYTLPLQPQDKFLIFSFVGMKGAEVEIKGRTVIDQVMEKAVAKIDEVVVTGIFTKKAASYTGSAVTVQAKELQQFGNRNVVTSLRNIEPSFNIVENNLFGSDPNRLPEIQIRGNSSVPNVTQLQDQTRVGLNTPLIILDGFESTLQKLIDINENEVESITVLKDASATAIYGSRGANGVVVVQTKAPTAGKLRITYRGDVNVEAPDLTAYSLLNARDKLDLEQKVGLYNYARAETDVPLKRYYNWVLNEVNSGVNTDWMAIPLRMGVGQRHNFRLEGGDQTFRYSASVQNNNIQGVMKGSFRNTFNGTINLTYMLKGIKFTNQLNIGIGNNQNSPYGASSVYNLLGGFSDYVKLNPYWRPYDANGNVNKYLGDPGNYDYTSRWNSLPTNPLYNATLNGFDKTKTSSIVNNFAIEWTVVKDLVLRSRIGFTLNMDQNDIFRSADNTAFANYTIDNVFRKGDYYYDVVNGFNYDGSLSLTYSKVLAEKHSIFFGFDYNMRQNKSSEYNFRAEGFSNSNFDFPSMALQYAQGERPGGKESLVRAVGFTGNINYTYDNRYYIDASFREDGSSQFGAKKRFAPFWSTGIGWNLHSEKFMKDQTIVNRLKIRGSLGITGTQNFDAYQALSTYQYYTGDRYYNWMGAYMMGLGNDNLRWQQKMNYDIGLEAQLLKNRIAFTFDYYIGTTKDLVSSINLPPSNGFSSYVENIGTMKNTGFESKLTLFPYRDLQKGIAWSVTGVVFRNSNKIIDISQALIDAQAVINKTGGSNPNIQYQVGYSTNTIWVVPSLGIDPSTGKELYLDLAGNPTYTWSSLNLRACGNTEPKYQGNFSTMFRYKTFSANLTFGYRYGGQQYNRTLIDKVENANYQYNVDSRVYDNRWQNPGDMAGFKGLMVTTVTQMTSRFVQDEKTLNCQNINVQYDLRSAYLKKNLGLELLTFSSSMADLFYISTVKRERGTSYPFSHNISFSLSATF